MSGNKSISLTKLEDSILGVFAKAPTSKVLDHAVRFLSTWSGSDKAFMVIQFTLKLIAPFLHLRAKLQHRAGKGPDVSSAAATALSSLSGKIGDSRMLYRASGLLSMYQWLTSLERTSPQTRRLLTIERLQGWSMLFYYPLEHIYYLRAQGILPAFLKARLPFTRRELTLNLNASKLALWSTRAWAIYLLLQFLHLREDLGLWKAQKKALAKTKNRNVDFNTEMASLTRRKDTMLNELFESFCNLPLAIHWSLEKGYFKNDIWPTVLGLAAALASFRAGWRATASPIIPPSPSVDTSADIAAEVPEDPSIIGKEN